MWIVKGYDLQMTAGDYGVQLPMRIRGVTLGGSDTILFTLKNAHYVTVLTKTFTNIQDNTANLALTSAESESLTAGNYIYTLDWYQSGQFMCNLIDEASFKVVAKA